MDTLKLVDYACENESLRWQISVLQVDQAQLIHELQKLMKDHEQCQDHKLKARIAEKECESLREQLKQLKDENIVKT